MHVGGAGFRLRYGWKHDAWYKRDIEIDSGYVYIKRERERESVRAGGQTQISSDLVNWADMSTGSSCFSRRGMRGQQQTQKERQSNKHKTKSNIKT